MDDLLVVGLDLATGQEVHAGDRESWEWYGKGHNGDQTLVCRECYDGTDLPGGPRQVALVPKGRKGGARRAHFAHPPGMAPPGGRHNPETLWHAEGKQLLRQWAQKQGAAAQVEAWTGDGRRRSDVAITVPGGGRLALEVQLGDITDAEWLARHNDYVQAGITDVWLWHPQSWIPRVVFDRGQPGWRLDLTLSRIGLVHAQPAPVTSIRASETSRCIAVHWPPCPDDPLDTLWMPLAAAQLAAEGIEPSAEAAAELARQAEKATLRAEIAKQATLPGTRRTRAEQPLAVTVPAPRPSDSAQQNGNAALPHYAFRYDAFPPWSDPDTWWYWCDACGNSQITGAELKASPIIHIVKTAKTNRSGQLEIIRLRFGGGIAQRRS